MDVGDGTRSPSSRSPSMCAATASRADSNASCIVLPAEKHPGRSGMLTPKSLPFSLWITAGYRTSSPPCPTGLPEDAAERPRREVPLRVGDGDLPPLFRVLELVMASFDMVEHPPFGSQSPDDIGALHGVYHTHCRESRRRSGFRCGCMWEKGTRSMPPVHDEPRSSCKKAPIPGPFAFPAPAAR